MLIPKQKKQMIKLVQVVNHGNKYNLRETVVNSAHITSIIPDDSMAAINARGNLPEGLHDAQQFSKITFTNGKEITVVGSPDIIGTKAKNVLHG